MNVSTVELRQKMADVLLALSRKEPVTVFRRGMAVGVLYPLAASQKKSVRSHAFFGMKVDASVRVNDEMNALRGGRHRGV